MSEQQTTRRTPAAALALAWAVLVVATVANSVVSLSAPPLAVSVVLGVVNAAAAAAVITLHVRSRA